MTQYFITGIGTGVGKTFVTAALLNQAQAYCAIKPVLSGFDPAAPLESDAGELLAAMNRPLSELDRVSPWRFAAPLSPHLAAAREGQVVDPEALLAFCRHQMVTHPQLLIEGVGGLMVPITTGWLVRDWVEALGLPVILVSASYLGAINHTLLSLEALHTAGLRVQAVIVSESDDSAGLDDTVASIRPFLPKAMPLLALPRQSSWKDAPDLLSVL